MHGGGWRIAAVGSGLNGRLGAAVIVAGFGWHRKVLDLLEWAVPSVLLSPSHIPLYRLKRLRSQK